MLYTIQLFTDDGYPDYSKLHKEQTVGMVVTFLQNLKWREYWREDPWAVVDIFEEKNPEYPLMRVTMDDLKLRDYVEIEMKARDNLCSFPGGIYMRGGDDAPQA